MKLTASLAVSSLVIFSISGSGQIQDVPNNGPRFFNRSVVAGFSPRSWEFAGKPHRVWPERGLKPAITVQPSRIIEDDVTQLVRTVLEKQKSRPYWFHLRSITYGFVPYVFDVKSRVIKYDSSGAPKELGLGCGTTSGATGVFVPVEETLLYIPLEFCGRPVDTRTSESWRQRREEKLAAVKRRSDAEKAKIQGEAEKNRKERALFWDEFVKAFRFQIIEHRILNERPTIMVSFNPDPQYRPSSIVDTKYLPKLRGQIWIDDIDKEIAHFGAEFTENVSAGFGVLGKVSAGTSYFMDLSKQIDDRWLPVKAETVLNMRALLVMKTNQKYTYEYSNYRKFSTDVIIR